MAQDAGSISSAIRLELNQLRNDIRLATSSVNKFGADFDKSTETTAKKSKQNFDQVGLAAVALAGVLANAFRNIIGTFADYEQSLANVQAVSGATGSELLALKDAAEEAGATTRFTASQAADALFFLASAGFEATDSVQALDGVLLLAQATGSDLAKSSDTLTATLSQFGLEAGEAARVSNVFAAANANSQASLAKLQTSLRQVGPVAGSLGISLEETTASLQALFNAGFQGEQAGTALRSILLDLADSGSTVSQELEALGVDLNDVNPEIVGLTGAVETLTESGVELGEVFGKETAAQILVLAQTGGDALRQLEADVTGTNAAFEAAEIQTNTLRGSFDEFGSALESATNAGIESISPFLRDLLGLLSDLLRGFRELPSGVQAIVTTLGALGAAFGVAAAGARFLGTSITTVLGPVGLAITGVVAGVTAIGTAFAATQRDAQQATAQIIVENNKLIQSNDESIKGFSNTRNELRQLLGVTDNYNTAQKLTKDQIDALIGAYPELAAQIDTTTASVQDALDAERELSRLRAREQLKLIQEQKEAREQEVEDQRKSTEEQVELLELYQDGIRETRRQLEEQPDNAFLSGRLSRQIDAVQTLQGTVSRYRSELEELEGQQRILEIQEQNLIDIIDGTAEAREREARVAADAKREADEAAEAAAREAEARRLANQRALQFIQGETDTRIEALQRERDAILQGVTDRQIIANVNEIFERKITAVREEQEAARLAILEESVEEEEEIADESLRIKQELARRQQKLNQGLAEDEAERVEAEQKRLDRLTEIQEEKAKVQEDAAQRSREAIEAQREAAERAAEAEEERVENARRVASETIKIRREILLNSLEGIERERTAELQALKDRRAELQRLGVDEIDIAEFVASEKERIDQEYLDNRDKAERDSFRESLDLVEQYINDIGGLVNKGVSAFSSLFSTLIENEQERLDSILEQQTASIDARLQASLDAIDEETRAKLEAEGLIEETRIERLKREAQEAIAAGDAETAAEKEDEARRLEILAEAEEERTRLVEQAEEEKRKSQEKTAKRQAELQYQVDLARWVGDLASATVTGSQAILNAIALLPVPPFPYAIAAGAAVGLELAAIAASKPTPPQLQTGGIAIPSGGGSAGAGAQVVVAENNSPELMLNSGESGRPFLREFAQEIAAQLNSTVVVQSVLDGRVIAEAVAKQVNNGRVRFNR